MPDWKYEIGRRLAGVKREPAREAAIVEELAQYLEDYYAEGKTIKHHFTRFYLFSVHKIILASSIPIRMPRAVFLQDRTSILQDRLTRVVAIFVSSVSSRTGITAKISGRALSCWCQSKLPLGALRWIGC